MRNQSGKWIPHPSDMPVDLVRDEAETLHRSCGANDLPIDDAFCTCWADACGLVGPCGDCYVCRDSTLTLASAAAQAVGAWDIAAESWGQSSNWDGVRQTIDQLRAVLSEPTP